jgi:hypothetical protein
MAEGILAMFGKPKKAAEEKSDDEDSEPSSVKARAVRDMFRCAKELDWEGASEAFHRAYVECSRKAEKAEGETDDDELESDLDDEG